MDKIFLKSSSTSFPKTAFLSFLKASHISEESFTSSLEGASLLLERKESMRFISSFPAFCEDLSFSLAGVIGGENNPFLPRFLPGALTFLPGKISYPSDLLFKAFSFGDFSLLSELRFPFQGLDYELIKTGEEFLRTGQRGDYASEALYIHRNTLLYRLNAFREKTGLDLHDYHDALFFELYLHYGRH